jgi:hypothetical protein
MSESSIEPFDIPDGGGDGLACQSVSKGFVLHVDKCVEHDHWIHLHSLNISEYISDGDTFITTGGNLNVAVDGDHTETVSGDRVEEISGSHNESIAVNYSSNINGLRSDTTSNWEVVVHENHNELAENRRIESGLDSEFIAGRDSELIAGRDSVIRAERDAEHRAIRDLILRGNETLRLVVELSGATVPKARYVAISAGGIILATSGVTKKIIGVSLDATNIDGITPVQLHSPPYLVEAAVTLTPGDYVLGDTQGRAIKGSGSERGLVIKGALPGDFALVMNIDLNYLETG